MKGHFHVDLQKAPHHPHDPPCRCRRLVFPVLAEYARLCGGRDPAGRAEKGLGSLLQTRRCRQGLQLCLGRHARRAQGRRSPRTRHRCLSREKHQERSREGTHPTDRDPIQGWRPGLQVPLGQACQDPHCLRRLFRPLSHRHLQD